MKVASRRLALWIACAMSLTGCGSAEDRIAKAFPVGKDVEVARVAFDAAMGSLPAERKQALEAAYATQLKLRALECGKGYQPSAFEGQAAIREHVGNDECFVREDARLRQWLGMQRAGVLVAMPALRPIPDKPAPRLAASDVILAATFADAAGVVLLQSRSKEELLDLNDGKVLRLGDRVDRSIISELSPNGRVIARAQPGGAVLQDAESGEVLATLVDSPRAYFAGSHGLVYVIQGKAAFHDFFSGSDTVLPFPQHVLSAVIPVPGKPADYVLLGDNLAAGMSIACQASGCTPRLQLEARMPVIGGWAPMVAVVGDSAYFFGGREFVQLQLATLQARAVSFDPMFLMNVMPAPQPGMLLLVTGSRVSGSRNGPGVYLYAPGAATLAKVDAAQWPSTRLVHAKSLGAILALDEARLAPIEPIAAAAPEHLSTALNAMQFDAQVAKLESMDRLQAMRSAQGLPPAVMPGSPPPVRPMASATSSFPPGEAGLTEAVRAGALRPGNSGDLDAWKSAYTAKTGRSVGRDFDDRIRMMQVYVITGDLTIPSGLAGAHAVVFVLKRGAPFPRGNAGHSMILDVQSGSCSGATCGIAVR